MAGISAKQVKELRDLTGAGMLDVKKALEETNGDVDKAVDLLRTKGLASAAKKSDRIAAEGLAATAVNGNVAAIIEVNSETDFVAKNDDFKQLVDTIVNAVAQNNPADMDEALAIEVDGVTIQDLVTDATARIGERISFRRFQTLEKTDADVFGAYNHGGSIAAIVKITGSNNEEVAYDVAMHAAALAPKYTTRDDFPEDVVEAERKIQIEKALGEGKPENIVEKMVVGRMNRFFAENALVEQDFVKDSDLTVKEYVAKAGGEVSDFVRFSVGEGLEKRQDDFAAEVAAEMNKNK